MRAHAQRSSNRRRPTSSGKGNFCHEGVFLTASTKYVRTACPEGSPVVLVYRGHGSPRSTELVVRNDPVARQNGRSSG
jgi:hypothetical protein